MKPAYITVPFWADLTTEKNWVQQDDSRNRFGVVRWHFVLKERQLDEKPKYGERLAGLDAPAGSGAKFTYRRTLEILDLETTIEQTAQDNEMLQSLSAEIRAEAAVPPVGKLSSVLVSQLKQTMKTSFSESFQVSHSTKSGHELTTEVSYDSSGAAQPLAHVRKFQRNRAVLYLAYIDYLVVDYRRQLGIRKRRQKSPAPHQNVIKINTPVAAIEYWKEYDGIYWVNEATHVNEVPEPYELEVVDAMGEKSGFVSFPRVHTLHRISNAAFPLKWIKRKGAWTEDELIAIEEKEYVEGPEDSWIWQRRK